jgi:hypothetical protein
MAFELIDNGATLQYFGNVFVPELRTDKPVVVEGDLITPLLECPKLTLMHGSLLCPVVRCPELTAEILGVFDLSQPFVQPPQWAYVWLRPFRTLPIESSWSSIASIEGVSTWFSDSAIVTTAGLELVKPLISRVRARPNCTRARVLFMVALEELLDQPGALTALGEQVARCLVTQKRLPDHWRF